MKITNVRRTKRGQYVTTIPKVWIEQHLPNDKDNIAEIRLSWVCNDRTPTAGLTLHVFEKVTDPGSAEASAA